MVQRSAYQPLGRKHSDKAQAKRRCCETRFERTGQSAPHGDDKRRRRASRYSPWVSAQGFRNRNGQPDGYPLSASRGRYVMAKSLGYLKRNRNIALQGFDSYKAYLASDLWKSIRATVLKRDKHACLVCGERATEVHHKSYKMDAIVGAKTLSLMSLCRNCHVTIEFSGQEKLSVREANRKLNQAFKDHGTTPPKKCSICKVNYVPKKNPDRTCRACRKIRRQQAATIAP